MALSIVHSTVATLPDQTGVEINKAEWNADHVLVGTAVEDVTATLPVVSSGGATPDISMAAASATVDGYLKSIDWGTFNAKMLSPMTNQGDIIYGGALGAPTRLGIGGANTVLHGGASNPVYSAVVEADISLSANSTNDVTTARHGFCPVLPNNSNLFFNGQGNYTLPSGLTISASYSATAFSGQTSVTVTHNFGTYPLVQVVDNTGAMLIPQSVVNNTLNDFTVTFLSSTTGTIMASVGSPQPQALTVANVDYVALTTDRIIQVASTGKTVTLYTAVGNTGRELIINNATAGNVFVNTTSSQTISAQLSQTLPSYSSMTVYSDGSHWWII